MTKIAFFFLLFVYFFFWWTMIMKNERKRDKIIKLEFNQKRNFQIILFNHFIWLSNAEINVLLLRSYTLKVILIIIRIIMIIS